MTVPDEPRAQRATLPRQAHGAYTLHPLSALDGVLIHLTLNGETVGFAFGPTEEAAAAAAAQDLVVSASADVGGAAR
jgi:hypothetical protein